LFLVSFYNLIRRKRKRKRKRRRRRKGAEKDV
jgi:hypothetical protein